MKWLKGIQGPGEGGISPRRLFTGVDMGMPWDRDNGIRGDRLDEFMMTGYRPLVDYDHVLPTRATVRGGP